MTDVFHKLEEIGCPEVASPINASEFDGELPFVAIIRTEVEPTETEVITISELIVHLARVNGAPASKAGYREAPTVTLRKVRPGWEYIQPSRSEKTTWKSVPNLQQLFTEL